MAKLHETRMGKTLIEHTIPKIARELKRIADSLELIIKQIKEETLNNEK